MNAACACFVLRILMLLSMILKIREGISMFKCLIAKHSIGRRRLQFLGMATHVTIVFPAASGSYLTNGTEHDRCNTHTDTFLQEMSLIPLSCCWTDIGVR